MDPRCQDIECSLIEEKTHRKWKRPSAGDDTPKPNLQCKSIAKNPKESSYFIIWNISVPIQNSRARREIKCAHAHAHMGTCAVLEKNLFQKTEVNGNSLQFPSKVLNLPKLINKFNIMTAIIISQFLKVS